MIVVSGRSGKYSRGMVEMNVCSHAYPARYVACFISVLDQCSTVGAVKTYSGCRRRAVVDIFTFLCSTNARFQIMSAPVLPGRLQILVDRGGCSSDAC